MISWILFFQTPYNMVKFITNEDANYQILNYFKFKDFIFQFQIKNRGDFNKHFDSFHTVLLNCTDGSWEEIKQEIKESSFSEMLKLNPGIQEIEEEKKKDPILKRKEFLRKFFDFKKNSLLNK